MGAVASLSDRRHAESPPKIEERRQNSAKKRHCVDQQRAETVVATIRMDLQSTARNREQPSAAALEASHTNT
jgi:hypothetical protein